MSKKIKIDDLFQKKLDNYASATPEHLWNSIETQLAKEPDSRKSKPFWLFASAAVFFIALFGGTIWWDNPEPAASLASATSTNSAEAQSNTNFTEATHTTNIEKNESFGKNIETEAADSKLSVSTIQKPNERKVNEPLSNRKATKSWKQDSVKSKKYKSDKTNALAQTENTRNLEKSILNLTPVSEGRQGSDYLLSEKQSEEKNSKNFVFDSSLQENTSRLPVVPLFKKPFAVQPLKIFSLKEGCINSSFKIMPKPKFSIDALLGFDYASRVIRGKSAQYSDYASNRMDTERYHSSYSTGTRFSVAYSSGFVWRIGLMYNQLTEKIVLDESRFGDLPNVDILNDRNKYQFVDVPIMIGYEFDHRDMVFGFNVGTYVNLMFKSPSKRNNFILNVPGAEEEIIRLSEVSSSTSLNDDVFRGPLGLSFYTSVFGAYNLTNNISLLFEPNMLVRTQSLTVDEFPTNQRYINIGLNTGLRFQF